MSLNQLKNYAYLMRLNKPLPIFLLLWPTMWALWLASSGKPDGKTLIIFILGVLLMRSAGCIMNDFADRNFDGLVKRTAQRPLANKKVSIKEAFILFFILISFAFGLVLMLNALTMQLALLGLVWVVIYPLLKRVTYFPQLGLGVAFSWGVPMAFAAELNQVPARGWLLFAAAALWPIIYDTYYAMVDRDDDKLVGIKSTAVWWGKNEIFIIGFLQILFLLMMGLVGWVFDLTVIYYVSLAIVGLLFAYQQYLVKNRDRQACLKAFLNNHWVGLTVFLGVLGNYILISV